MKTIITKIHNLIKDTDDLITFEESVKHLMDETFTELVSDAFTHLNKPIKDRAQKEKHTVVRNNEPRTIQFSFGAVGYHRTLLKMCLNKAFYPLYVRLRQRYSLLVEVQAAELGSEIDLS